MKLIEGVVIGALLALLTMFFFGGLQVRVDGQVHTIQLGPGK